MGGSAQEHISAERSLYIALWEPGLSAFVASVNETVDTELRDRKGPKGNGFVEIFLQTVEYSQYSVIFVFLYNPHP